MTVYDEMMESLNQAYSFLKTGKGAKLTRVKIAPVKKYTAAETVKLRKRTGMSQVMFAQYLGVSHKTVEAWEEGKNVPSGCASRLLNMMELDSNVTKKYPFVQYEKTSKIKV